MAKPEKYIVVHHTHKEVEEGTAKPKPRKKIDPRIGRAKRLADEVELWEQKAANAQIEMETHPIVDEIERAKLDVDWFEKESDMKDRQAIRKRLQASRANALACDKVAEAEKLSREARQLKAAAVELKAEADKLERANKKALAASNQNGPHNRVRELEKRFNTETHRIAKRGREAQKKAEKLKKRLAIVLEEIAPLLEENGNGTGKEKETGQKEDLKVKGVEREEVKSIPEKGDEEVGNNTAQSEASQKNNIEVQKG